MKLSFDWLSEYVDLSGLTAHQVAEKLTMGAFEVEEVTVIGPDLEGPLVVGEIMEIHQHPNADKIRLTKTRVAPGAEPLEIVCGAGNIKVGQRIPVALAGARVVNRHDGTPLIIKTSAIRGVKSNGMLCSASELGIKDPANVDGILIFGEVSSGAALPEIGSDIRQHLPVKPDYILHVEPRSNRGDALSVLGLAREVAALFGRPLKSPSWNLAQYQVEKAEAADHCPAWVENEADCAFLTLRTITDIKVGPSHPDIVARLEAIGMRSVNNVVDITNYVMHELGQPLHAYDRALLKNGSLGARRAKAGERLTTIDGKERSLSDEMLVIADQAKGGDSAVIVGVAGIMGGKDSEITESSTALVLEAACFTPAVVRRGSRLLGLSSDASLRFERGVDVASVLNASNRAAYLIAKYCGANEKPAKLGALTTAGADQVEPGVVHLRSSAIKRLLGITISDEKVKELLSPLGFQVEGGGDDFKVLVPSFRKEDVKREADLIEEVCRLNGYDKIEATMPAATMAVAAPDDTLNLVRSALTGQGLSEAWLSSLVPQSQEVDGELAVRVLNPLSKDHELLRQSLVPGLIGACAYNQDRGRKDIWLFEHGRVYFKEAKAENNGKKESDKKGATAVREDNHLAALITGSRAKGLKTASGNSSMNSAEEEIDFHQIKGLVENLLDTLNIDERKLVWKQAKSEEAETLHPWLHPYRTAVLTLNRPEKPGSKGKSILDSNIALGYVGEIHPRYGDAQGLRARAFVFELNLNRLQNERKARKFAELANTPEVVRDLTADFNLELEVQFDQFIRQIWKHGGNHLRSVDAVSIYQAPGDAKKSFTCRLTFQHPTETLTNEEIEKVMGSIREILSRELSASFRL